MHKSSFLTNHDDNTIHKSSFLTNHDDDNDDNDDDGKKQNLDPLSVGTRVKMKKKSREEYFF